jgi:hypothetical protein
MRTALGFIIVIVVLVGLLYLSGTRFAAHQKITLSVATPAGVKSASAVQKLSFEKSLPDWVVPGDAGGSSIWLSGEAVALEIAPQKYLFALLTDTPRAWDVFFPRQSPASLGPVMAASIGKVQPLTPDQYPLLVTFGDINDPASVRRVDPADLAASFGAGYRLDTITMTITDEPVTEGKVEAVLGWLNWPREKILAAGNGENPVKFAFGKLTIFLDKPDFRSNR